MARSSCTIVTATGASGSAVTLTLPAPGSGQRHHIASVAIDRFAAAALTVNALPTIVSTTNLPGAIAFSLPAEAAQPGTIARLREAYSPPLAALAPGSATTITCPATTGVIWRATAAFFVAP